LSARGAGMGGRRQRHGVLSVEELLKAGHNAGFGL
jgi:hypothetical protein